MTPLSRKELFDLLEDSHERFNRPDFIEDDPVGIPHRFDRKEDIEIAGFLAALIAWGRREMIIRSANSLMERMDHSPFDFVMNAKEEELERMNGFVHRTFNQEDAKTLIRSLRFAYEQHGGLERIFSAGITEESTSIGDAILHARKILTSAPDFLPRTGKHLANPAKGSSAKRLSMYLRWMVRKDKRGVDFGIWKEIPAALLICPLDVHTGNVGRQLGLLTRKQNDWKAALELTENLRTFCPQDPVKYDFSLFGLGVSGLLS